MGTRGLMGVRIDGIDKLTYNHWDSYPSGLGTSIVNDIRLLLKDPGDVGMAQLAHDIKVVDPESTPTPEEKSKFKQFLELSVSNKSDNDWYCLLYALQGYFAKTLKAGIMIDAHDFVNDSLFCKWMYVANLDSKVFEVYQGFQRKPHSKGRYSTQQNSGEYHPLALIAEFPLDNIPDNWVEQLPKQER
jgi:hypothetical protein